MSDTKFDTRGLDKLIKALSADPIEARVGILKKDARGNGGSNASIGMKHEFGQDGMPIRSFLRVPIAENMQKYLDASQAFTQDTVNQVLREGSLVDWVKKLGLIGETIVLDAFSSNGFGKWQSSNMKYKKNHQTLVETQQLRDSITSEVG